MFGERLFGLDAQTLFDAGVLLVTMFVLFLFLSYFLFNPVRDMLNKRKERIKGELEKLKVADDVKKEIVSVATAMAGKVAAASIDEAKQQELIDETLKEMGEDTWLS